MESQKWQNDLSSFPGKPFNITIIQVYAPTSNAEEAEVEWFYEDLQDLLELTPKQMSNAAATLIILKHKSYLKSFNGSCWIQHKIQHFNLNRRLYLTFHLAHSNSKFYVKWAFMWGSQFVLICLYKIYIDLVKCQEKNITDEDCKM